jgi:peptidyl-prolyl cis-trans isomerase A (cyclophilin A)
MSALTLTALLAASAGFGFAQTAVARLMNPANLNEKAPEKFKAKFTTTKGEFTILVTRAWAPLGADRFYNLVKNGFYDGTGFHRVHPGFVAQWGLHGNPAVQAKWEKATLKDEPVKKSNQLGLVAFSADGANSRSTQIYVNMKDNSSLDRQGFPPFGDVVSGIGIFTKLWPSADKPTQPQILKLGNLYLKRNFPQLDYVTKAVIE